MKKTFDPISYANVIGKELVQAFDTANAATTPGLVGGSREVPTRKKLENLLPEGIGVGSGCVIDSYGETSRQIDAIIYEKHICPVYSINETPETTYYPCEGVIAVGEIKSSLDSNELTDIFAKIASVKHLQRFSTQMAEKNLRDELAFPYRHYGTTTSVRQRLLGVAEYCQTDNSQDKIFGFALADKLRLRSETLCKKFIENVKEIGVPSSPNLIVSLDKGVLCPSDRPSDNVKENGIIKLSLEDAHGVYHVNKEYENFRFLISTLYQVYFEWRTVPVSSFERYFDYEGILMLPAGGVYIPLETSESNT